MIDDDVLNELIVLYQRQMNCAEAFSEAAELQASKNQLDATALKQYVRAMAADKLGKLRKQHDTLVQLGMWDE